jgi:hypothetical protein
MRWLAVSTGEEGVVMTGADDLLAPHVEGDEDLLQAVRRRLEVLQKARLLRELSVNELTEHDELLRLEQHLLQRRH